MKNNIKKMEKNKKQPSFESQRPDIYDHTISKIIYIMPDTLDNKLRDFEDCIKNKGNIFNDFGLVIAFLATLLTVSQFKDFLKIPGYVWQAIFMVFLALSILKLAINCYYGLFKKSIKRKDIIEQLLDGDKKKK